MFICNPNVLKERYTLTQTVSTSFLFPWPTIPRYTIHNNTIVVVVYCRSKSPCLRYALETVFSNHLLILCKIHRLFHFVKDRYKT